MAKATIGDPGSQARWEALALLLAVVTWRQILFQTEGSWRFLGDALGMLQGAVQFKAKDPAINQLFMELALMTAGKGICLQAEHLWSQDNLLADELSRSLEGAPIPPELVGVPESREGEFEYRILRQPLS